MTDPAPPRKNRLDDDVLKAAYQIANRHRDGHLSDRDWEQLACGDLDDFAKRAALSHVTSCETCSTIHRSLIALNQESAVFDPRSSAQPPSPAFAWRRWAVGGGLAAAAILTLAVLVDNPERSRRASDVTRTNVEGTSITVTQSLSLPDRRLAWTSVRDADLYDVRISDATGALKWTTRVTATTVEVPADMTWPRGTYYLQISATRDGATIGSSSLVPIQVE